MLTLSMMPAGPERANWRVQVLKMLSIPHMIVVFLVVLVVFGPQKLPELARSFGKLMAEFRKASNDFKSAFEEEMRDLERQARIAELKKQVAEATAAANTAMKNSALPASETAPAPGSSNEAGATLASTAEWTEATAGSRVAEASTSGPVPESIPRSDGANGETVAPETSEAREPEAVDPYKGNGDHPTEPSATHDQQQRA